MVVAGNFGFYGKTLKQKGIQSELEAFVKGTKRFTVPVYTVWGSREDVDVVCRFRRGEWQVPNLFILDEQHSYSFGGVRLFGLGGAVHTAKLLDSGEGNAESVAGENGRMWTTLLQVGEPSGCLFVPLTVVFLSLRSISSLSSLVM